MLRALSPIFHCDRGMQKLSAMGCQRLASAAVTDTAENRVTANTNYTALVWILQCFTSPPTQYTVGYMGDGQNYAVSSQ